MVNAAEDTSSHAATITIAVKTRVMRALFIAQALAIAQATADCTNTAVTVRIGLIKVAAKEDAQQIKYTKPEHAPMLFAIPASARLAVPATLLLILLVIMMTAIGMMPAEPEQTM